MEFNKPKSMMGFEPIASSAVAETPISTTPQNDVPIVENVVEHQEESIENTQQESSLVQKSILETIENNVSDDLSEYEEMLNIFGEQGYVEELPEGIEAVKDLKTFQTVLEHNLKQRDLKLVEQTVQETKKNVQDELFESMDELLKQAVIYDSRVDKNGGNTVQFLKELLSIADVAQLDENDPMGQQKICLDYLTQTRGKEEGVEFFDTFKDNPDKLKEKADLYKPKLIEIAQKKAAEQVYVQNVFAEQEKKGKQLLTQKCINVLREGKVFGMSIDNTEAQNIMAAMTVDREVKVKGRKVQMDIFDQLVQFHKYDEKGNPELLMLAYIAMTNPDKIPENYKKQAAGNVVKQLRSDNANIQHGKSLFNRTAPPLLGNKTNKSKTLLGL